MPEIPKDDVTQEAEQMRKAPPLLPTEAYHCMECGFGVRVDEDECCTTCGFDCELRPMPEWITAAVTSLEARAESAEARLAQVEKLVSQWRAMAEIEAHVPGDDCEAARSEMLRMGADDLASLLSSPASVMEPDLTKERNWWRDILAHYGDHDAECPSRLCVGADCRCGLGDLLDGTTNPPASLSTSSPAPTGDEQP